jgi:hypothetical protein
MNVTTLQIVCASSYRCWLGDQPTALALSLPNFSVISKFFGLTQDVDFHDFKNAIVIFSH